MFFVFMFLRLSRNETLFTSEPLFTLVVPEKQAKDSSTPVTDSRTSRPPWLYSEAPGGGDGEGGVGEIPGETLGREKEVEGSGPTPEATRRPDHGVGGAKDEGLKRLTGGGNWYRSVGPSFRFYSRYELSHILSLR